MTFKIKFGLFITPYVFIAGGANARGDGTCARLSATAGFVSAISGSAANSSGAADLPAGWMLPLPIPVCDFNPRLLLKIRCSPWGLGLSTKKREGEKKPREWKRTDCFLKAAIQRKWKCLNSPFVTAQQCCPPLRKY